MSDLRFLERPADGDAAGLLILHHGRGADEHDLYPLADVLDPTRRLHVVTPRAPLRLQAASGFHWYVVPRVGHPDPPSFRSACERLASLHDELAERYGIGLSRTILGGFSMGAVMSYALGLALGRQGAAGILALSGFVPQVEGWDLDLAGHAATSVLIAHGRRDQVIPVDFGRRAHALLEQAGFAVEYHESAAMHSVDPAQIPSLAGWVARTLS